MKRPIYPGLIGRVVIQVWFNVWNATSQEDISDHFWTTHSKKYMYRAGSFHDDVLKLSYLSTKQLTSCKWDCYMKYISLKAAISLTFYLYCITSSCFVLYYVLLSYFRTLAKTQREKIVKKKIENIVTLVNNVILFCLFAWSMILCAVLRLCMIGWRNLSCIIGLWISITI